MCVGLLAVIPDQFRSGYMHDEAARAATVSVMCAPFGGVLEVEDIGMNSTNFSSSQQPHASPRRRRQAPNSPRRPAPFPAQQCGSPHLVGQATQRPSSSDVATWTFQAGTEAPVTYASWRQWRRQEQAQVGTPLRARKGRLCPFNLTHGCAGVPRCCCNCLTMRGLSTRPGRRRQVHPLRPHHRHHRDQAGLSPS